MQSNTLFAILAAVIAAVAMFTIGQDDAPTGSAAMNDGATGGLEADFITPGQWQVSNMQDQILIWAHNGGSENAMVNWGITLADGSPLPSGWKVLFGEPTAELAGDGERSDGRGPSSYLDWTWTLATLQLPEGAEPGTYDILLSTGTTTTPGTLTVADAFERVSIAGDSVSVQYRGTFADTGKEFDSGSFPTTLGSGQTVAGFDGGLIGLALDEDATLVLPAALGYGYDTPASHKRFEGETLAFEVSITQFNN